MGYNLTFNCLLNVLTDVIDLSKLKLGKRYTITKNGARLYPVDIPIEICDEQHTYYGKVAVRRLTLEADVTTLEIEVLKIFSAAEAAVYTSNFISA